ncbi:TPA: hypothetical protein J0587_004605 [Salmonella enterica subsp. enterica serovar Kentucky]|nr:hypothetical protein [Salmonella enterica subsp. enterica serovar Kentucky]
MIKVIQQNDIFSYSEIDATQEPESILNMMTGRNLMEVYYHSVPVFRCNMGHSIEDDVFFCRINYKGNTAFISQPYRDVAKKCSKWTPDEHFAGNAVANFCDAFGVDREELKRHLDARRSRDSAVNPF